VEEEKGEKKEEYQIISKIELDELKRLHIIADQAPNKVIGTVNLQVDARKNLLDYHTALSKKYKFNPYKVGVNRHTGQLQDIPEEVRDPKRAKWRKQKEQQYDATSSREIGYRSSRNDN
jgi:hypothetical protein